MDKSQSPSVYLESFPDGMLSAHRILLRPLPFYIGRSSSAQWTIYSPKVSKEHVKIWQENGTFRIRDLGSRNGTFINGKRIEEAPLFHGDILHIAHEEFRVCFAGTPGNGPEGMNMTDPVTSLLPSSAIRDSQSLRELVDQELVFSLFQPIVHLSKRQVIGYEALGRGRHNALTQNPSELFDLAKRCGQERELSRVFRMEALKELGHLPDGCLVFLNLHPSEMNDNSLQDHLRLVRSALRPRQRLILEVHENATASQDALRQLRRGLQDQDIGLAFDDFGVGQTRLLELAEIPPDFIKLDMKLIRGLGEAKVRQGIVQSLCEIINNRGVQLIAEGIETAEEAQVCNRVGCALGQGFFWGKPQPAVNWREKS